MPVRTIKKWKEIIGEAKSPDDIAKAVLGNLIHYRRGGAYEEDDRKQMIAALNAYAQVHREIANELEALERGG